MPQTESITVQGLAYISSKAELINGKFVPVPEDTEIIPSKRLNPRLPTADRVRQI